MKKFAEIIKIQKDYFATGRTKDVNFRIKQLKKLLGWIKTNEWEIAAALRIDLNKPPFESLATETGVVLDELRHAIRNLRSWTSPRFVPTNIKNFPSYGRIYPEPYGVTLIMSPWNYPFMLTLVPLISAIAAGNCTIVKPSAYAPETSSLIVRMCSELFHGCFVKVVEGGRKENKGLLSQPFDKIFFTGSTEVGKTVMAAAAKNLTPVTLELGGKSPCIVDRTADIKLAAKRIVWGKFINAGQTCVAPDYILVHHSVKEKLLHEMSAAICRQYGTTPTENSEYPKIINDKHFQRLNGLMENQKIAYGGASNPQTFQIEPTIIDEPTWDSPVMTEEIFGPILPVISYSSPKEVVKLVTARPKPLALYVFTRRKIAERFFLKHISFGGGCINDTVVHLSVPHLPFGGVGESGMGNYHGKAGFDAFTHYRSVLHKPNFMDIPLRYPPYTDWAFKLLKLL